MSYIYIILLDKSNITKEEANIIKPSTYKDLLIQINQKLKKIPKNYELYIIDKNNVEIKINNENNYKIIEDILFIREIEKINLNPSIFQINYNKLSESEQEILDEKYNCILCSNVIKHEQPFFCYKCQKIFHENCLNNWDIKLESQNKKLSCPVCRYELPIEKWNKKINYEENRIEYAKLLNQINELKDKEINQNKLIKLYEKYLQKSIETFKIILNKISSIHSLLKLPNNNKLNDLTYLYSINYDDIYKGIISKVINEEFELLRNYLISHNTKTLYKQKTKQELIKENQMEKYLTNINKDKIKTAFRQKDNQNINNKLIINNNVNNNRNNTFIQNNNNNIGIIENQLYENKNKINLVYFAKEKVIYNIFGKEFVVKNKDNIELIINGKQNSLVNSYELKNGDNVITLIIKNKLINLSYMFYECYSLKNIDSLKYLDVKNVKNFSYMFYGCSLLSNIKCLNYWNISNGNNLSCIFSGCSSLLDITSLQNWNVSNNINFSGMFCGCSSLVDIKPLQNWNVLNGNTFWNMFCGCSSLSDITSLQNWNVSNCKDFSYMFCQCSLLSNISSLKHWNVSNGINFDNMFSGCISLNDISSLQNWNVANSNNFKNMFYGCKLLFDLKPLQNWNVSNCNYFSFMFYGCKSLSDIRPLQKWNVSKGYDFQSMFSECSPLLNLTPLKYWNIHNDKLNCIK